VPHPSAHPLPQSEARADAKQAGGGACTRCLDTAEERIERACACVCPTWVSAALSVTVVCVVCALIAAIGVFGTYPVLYDLCASPSSFALHVTTAAFLLFNIFFNYALAVGRSPGRVSQFYDVERRPPERHALDDFTHCSR
jgi:hypothetical protein